MGAFDLQDIPQLVYLGAIFVAVLGYAIAAHRRNLGLLLRHARMINRSLCFEIFGQISIVQGMGVKFRQNGINLGHNKCAHIGQKV